MAGRRKIEIFSAGCAVCEATVRIVEELACPSCEVSVLDMKDSEVAARALQLGIASVPAVLIDGELAVCCAGRGPDEAALKRAGIGERLP